jgi:hypothetical protein
MGFIYLFCGVVAGWLLLNSLHFGVSEFALRLGNCAC